MTADSPPTPSLAPVLRHDAQLLYDLDESLQFDPTGLEESTTPAAVLAAVEGGQFSRALPMALCLDEEELLRATWQRVPPDEVRPLTRYIAIALFVTNNHPPSMSRLGGSRRARAAAALR